MYRTSRIQGQKQLCILEEQQILNSGLDGLEGFRWLFPVKTMEFIFPAQLRLNL